jgi:hypothetical protein
MLAGMLSFFAGRPALGRRQLHFAFASGLGSGSGSGSGAWWLSVAAVLSLALGLQPARAQVETFMLQRGSNIGPETKVIPTNCVLGSDGSVSCDTQIVNPPSASPAKPQYQPFKN